MNRADFCAAFGSVVGLLLFLQLQDSGGVSLTLSVAVALLSAAGASILSLRALDFIFRKRNER